MFNRHTYDFYFKMMFGKYRIGWPLGNLAHVLCASLWVLIGFLSDWESPHATIVKDFEQTSSKEGLAIMGSV